MENTYLKKFDFLKVDKLSKTISTLLKYFQIILLENKVKVLQFIISDVFV